MGYIELHTSSAFSFLDGASLPETLIQRAAALGYPALALLDRDGVYGAPQFYRAAKAAGMKAIVGAELTVTSNVEVRTSKSGRGRQAAGGRPGATTRSSSLQSAACSPQSWTLPVLVSSSEGYRNLCRIITRAKLKAPKGESALTLEDLAGHTTGLIALAGRQALDAARHGVGGLIDRLVGIFGGGQVWIELAAFCRDEQAVIQSLLDRPERFVCP
jgi:error-prone DNA polymerase